eukprot:TRINITY_DN7842_c0_g2_i1.p1 TRINITY_DN7842_c0_g2~~TRINITY_DN7842_c0_g2_i1.p1  ORF type:complete len:271 (+),score=36.53 TRINITY_DN7842_c0_g2_i1:55-867(+)
MAALSLGSDANSAIDNVFKKYNTIIKPTARVFLLSTFIEDGVRMFLQFNDQSRYMRNTWRCGSTLAQAFIILNMVLQILPSIAIVVRKQVPAAVACLCSVVIMQMVAYQTLWDVRFILRNIALGGGLLFLLAEGSNEAKRVFALLPGLETKEERKNHMLQFFGRLLICLMFGPLVKFDSWTRIVIELIAIGFLVMVVVGFETRLAATALIILLFAENLLLNNFWAYSSRTTSFDFKLYDFFQTMSVIGSLMMVVALGPGGFSLDERKKSM